MKTFSYATALLISLLGSPGTARAEYWSDTDLSAYCRANDGTLEKGACMGYIIGIADTLAAGGQVGNSRACIKAGVSIGQLVDTVTHFLTTTHDIQRGSANTLVASVLADAFPCK